MKKTVTLFNSFFFFFFFSFFFISFFFCFFCLELLLLVKKEPSICLPFSNETTKLTSASPRLKEEGLPLNVVFEGVSRAVVNKKTWLWNQSSAYWLWRSPPESICRTRVWMSLLYERLFDDVVLFWCFVSTSRREPSIPNLPPTETSKIASLA